jgi:hypothetical protein
MNMKELAEKLSADEFNELAAHFCIQQAAQIERDPVPSEDVYETLKENAQWIFYDGMRSETAVAERISILLLSPQYAHLLKKDE